MRKTTRTRIQEYVELCIDGQTPTQISDYLYREYEDEVDSSEVVTHMKHLSRSGIDVLVSPPECNDCSFNGFDNVANIPSKCPNCRSEWISEPMFTIE